jgi:prepilin-type N-terminal cleavage/methylation domain-containing protein
VRPRAGSRQSGFTLIEMLVTLVLVGLGLALAAQLLMETSQMMVDAAAEQTETSLPLARARLRTDLQSCQTAQVVPGPSGRIAELWLLGRAAGPMRYRKVGRDLVREVASADGDWDQPTPVLRNVQSWDALPMPGGLVMLEIHLLRRTIRRSPLPTVPGTRGPLEEERVETLVVAPRGGGLGLGW